MSDNNHTLPDDIEELKRLVAAQQNLLQMKDAELREFNQKYENVERKYEELDTKYEDVEQRYEDLKQKYKYLQKLFFGRKSEKLTPEDELQGDFACACDEARN